jgi:hypothetical protein
MAAKLERYKVLSPDEVLPRIKSYDKPLIRPTVHNVPCHTNGLRLFTFKTKGLTCVTCKITGTFFAIERSKQGPLKTEKSEAPRPYHLNLYAVGEDGRDVLMTHDHILARCLGGKDKIENTQTMCTDCNSEKSKTENPMSGMKAGYAKNAVKRRRRKMRQRALKIINGIAAKAAEKANSERSEETTSCPC